MGFWITAINSLETKGEMALPLKKLVKRSPPAPPAVPRRYSFSLSGNTERLARTTSCPYRAIFGPSGQSQGVCPAPDSGKEMALGIAVKIAGPYFGNAADIDCSFRYQAVRHCLPEPRGCKGIVFIVINIHRFSPEIGK